VTFISWSNSGKSRELIDMRNSTFLAADAAGGLGLSRRSYFRFLFAICKGEFQKIELDSRALGYRGCSGIGKIVRGNPS
jgi:hypothetical protein